jgi:hypothetical protein
MAPVADAIHYSRKGFDGSGPPHDGVAGETIPLGGRLLRLVSDYDAMLTQGTSPAAAFAMIRSQSGCYDPTLLEAFVQTSASEVAGEVRDVRVAALIPGMVLAADAQSVSGLVLVRAGQEVTTGLIARLRNYAALADHVVEPLFVLDPAVVGVAAESADATGG